MLTRACPECGHGSAYWLEESSLLARIDYLRCAECAHVWHTPKNDPDAAPTVVMRGQPKRLERADARRG